MVDHRLLFLHLAILSINHPYWMSSLAITFEMRKVFHVFVVWYLTYYHIRIYSSQYQTQFLVSSRKASSVINFIWCVFWDMGNTSISMNFTNPFNVCALSSILETMNYSTHQEIDISWGIRDLLKISEFKPLFISTCRTCFSLTIKVQKSKLVHYLEIMDIPNLLFSKLPKLALLAFMCNFKFEKMEIVANKMNLNEFEFVKALLN